MSTPISCEQARLGLLRGETGAAVGAHLESCAGCRERMDQLAAALLVQGADAISCAECRSWLPDYLAATEAGEDAAGLLPKVHAHLDRCPECHAERLAVLAVLRELPSNLAPKPETYPDVDTAFLQPAGAGKGILGRGSLALAAILLLALGLFGLARLGGGSSPIDRGAHEPEPAREAVLTEAAAADAAPIRGVAESAIEAATAVPRLTPAEEHLARALPSATAISPAAQVTLAPTFAPTPPPPLPTERPPAGPTPPPPPAPSDPDPKPKAGPTGKPKKTDEPSPTPTPLMVDLCYIDTFGPTGDYLESTCDGFPHTTAVDLYRVEVSSSSRWTFSLCARTEMNTVLALYSEGGFDLAAPCEGRIAFNDDYCGLQSRLTVDLEPGAYTLLLSTADEDVSWDYVIRVGVTEAALPQRCPSTIQAPISAASATPSGADPAATPSAPAIATQPAEPIATATPDSSLTPPAGGQPGAGLPDPTRAMPWTPAP